MSMYISSNTLSLDKPLIKLLGSIWSENLKVRDHSEDLSIDGNIMLECILGKQGGKVWTGSIWLKIGASGGLL